MLDVERAMGVCESIRTHVPNESKYRRLEATLYLSKSVFLFIMGEHARAMENGNAGEAIFKELLGLAPESRHSYDPILKSACTNVVANCLRESNRLEMAVEKHKECIATLNTVYQKIPSDVSAADVSHFMAHFQLDYARTKIRLPALHNVVEKNLTLAISQWETLSRGYPKSTLYRGTLADAYSVLGTYFLAIHKSEEAKGAFKKAISLLDVLTIESPEIVTAWGDQGIAYIGMANVAKSENDEATEKKMVTKGRTLLEKAAQLSSEYYTYKAAIARLRE